MKKTYFAKYIYYNSKIYHNHYLLLNNEHITGISEQLPPEYKLEKSFKNGGIFPAFINAHTHLSMSLLSGLSDDVKLFDWLKRFIWPTEREFMSAEFIKDGTNLAALALIKEGVSLSNDSYFYPEVTAKIFSNIGLRCKVGVGVLETESGIFGENYDFQSKTEALLSEFSNDELISISLAPHAIYTVSADTYKKCIEFASGKNIQIHTHLSESIDEIDYCKSRYNKTPVEIMFDIGLLDVDCILAHCVHLKERDIQILGDKKVNIAHCPESNLKLACGISPIPELIDAGANILLGTDGTASNNDVDILSEIGLSAKLHKGYQGDPLIIPAKTAFDFATANAAKAFDKDIGALEKGKKADFIVVDFNKPHNSVVYNPLSTLVYSCKSSDISHFFINGKMLMENQKVTSLDEEQIIDKAKWWSQKIKNYILNK